MPTDLRCQKLAKLAVNYCVFVKPHEKIIISGGTEAQDFLLALYKETIINGAHPITRISIPGMTPFFYKHAKKHQIEKYPDIFEHIIKQSKKYIGINTESNTRELTSCDPKKITQRAKITRKITDLVCNNQPNMHRTTIAFPCQALAQDAEMSLIEYENFVYGACLQDWNKLSKRLHKIKNKFKENSTVHLKGQGVDLKFKVEGHLAKVDDGKENMPGGEIFMAPIKTTVNGHINFEYPSIRNGKEVTDIKLEFKDGKVINSSASKNQDFLQQMINTDENSQYIGEFGIGANPKITKYTKNLLFDEKISGTIHLALGATYKDNTTPQTMRESAIHWDIVKSMKKAKMIVDNKIIQENGVWKI
jgi:aminopeptidase